MSGRTPSMLARIKNTLKFQLERWVLQGAHYRLLFIASMIGLVSAVGGLLAFHAAGTEFASRGEAVWWAFLRLTDPGYLGDDKGVALRSLSTVVTVLGYVLFMGSLIAILTQWLDQTIRRLESGVTPIALRNHLVILGWSNRTPAIVRQLVLSEGRVQRFLRRHRARKLRIVILCGEVSARRRFELREMLGSDWDEHQIILRSGTPLRVEHLRRVDFLRAAAVIVPGSEIDLGGTDGADLRSLKTVLSVGALGNGDAERSHPLLVAEVFDARKIPAARAAYPGRIEVVASDGVISLLIAQNVRHQALSHVYSELLSHESGNNELHIRQWGELVGQRVQDLGDLFPRAVLLGVLRQEGERLLPVLNPPDGFRILEDDRLVFLARRYEDAAPQPGSVPGACERGACPGPPVTRDARRILLMGWNDKVPALIREFDTYTHESFSIDVLSALPVEDRARRLARYALQPGRVTLRHLEGDYAAPSDLERVRPETYDNVVILGSDWLSSEEEADARSLLGMLLLRRALAVKPGRKPHVLLELLDPENHDLLQQQEEVLISPLILSHILARVALRPALNVVFHELFSSDGAEILFRPVRSYGLPEGGVGFREIQAQAARSGETAIGVRLRSEEGAATGGVHLNPDRERVWRLEPDDELIVVVRYEG